MKKPDMPGIKTLDPEALFTLTEAARLLGVSHNGIRGWVHKGIIRAAKVGCRYFIQGSEIQRQVEVTDPMGD